MKKEPEIGQDYGTVFGLDPDKGQKMIYRGVIKFECVNGTKQLVVDSQCTYDKIVEYINRPSSHVGTI